MRLKKSLVAFSVSLLPIFIPAMAFAQEATAAEPAVSPWSGLAGGLAIAVAAFGGALAQGKTASAALEAIGRNPGASGQLFTPMILGLVFIESLVIYALIIAFSLV